MSSKEQILTDLLDLLKEFIDYTDDMEFDQLMEQDPKFYVFIEDLRGYVEDYENTE